MFNTYINAFDMISCNVPYVEFTYIWICYDITLSNGMLNPYKYAFDIMSLNVTSC